MSDSVIKRSTSSWWKLWSLWRWPWQLSCGSYNSANSRLFCTAAGYRFASGTRGAVSINFPTSFTSSTSLNPFYSPPPPATRLTRPLNQHSLHSTLTVFLIIENNPLAELLEANGANRRRPLARASQSRPNLDIFASTRKIHEERKKEWKKERKYCWKPFQQGR